MFLTIMPSGLPARRWAPNPRGAGELGVQFLDMGKERSYSSARLTDQTTVLAWSVESWGFENSREGTPCPYSQSDRT